VESIYVNLRGHQPSYLGVLVTETGKNEFYCPTICSFGDDARGLRAAAARDKYNR